MPDTTLAVVSDLDAPPTHATENDRLLRLIEAGTIAEAALPGDVYDLAPASTRDLGDEVWALHLAWGAAKAAAFKRRPAPPPGDDGQ